jgi:uncharacterized protein (TIGR00369 family)
MPQPDSAFLDAGQANDILRREFAPWVQDTGLRITDTSPNGCAGEVPDSDHLHRVGGMVSGQAMMAVADTAMVLALCSFFGEFTPVATIDMTTTFLRPAREGMTVEARVVKPGRSICFAEAELKSGGKTVCRATGTYMLPP